jgi:putative ABC transport system substrate-binding protein
VNGEQDAEGQARAAAFRASLDRLGWRDGRDVRIVVRWDAGDPGRARAHAEELVALEPDVIVVNGSPGTAAVRRATSRIPVVFVVVTDPLGAGYVRSLSRPGGNLTGFSTFAPEIGGKWLGLLREIAPGVKRVAFVTDPGLLGFGAIQREVERAASTFGVQVSTIAFRQSTDDLETPVASFARQPAGGPERALRSQSLAAPTGGTGLPWGSPAGGLIVAPTGVNNAMRDRIIALAARHRLPAIYPFQQFATSGGLLAYGFDALELFVRSAGYVDRILKGEKPGNLPVQAPETFETIVNLKTAKALGLEVSPSFLARADRVIE